MTWIPRLHLFELEDQPWFPSLIRNYGTDYLHFAERVLRVHRPMADKLAQLIAATGEHRILDLCSGGSGPIPEAVKDLASRGIEVTATLTDLYPNRDAFEHLEGRYDGRITGCLDPVDATAVPAELPGIRTVCNAIHHFRPEMVVRILRHAVESRVPVALFDLTDRRLLNIVAIPLLMPALVWLSTPFVRPFRWGRLLFTYVVPGVPLMVMWDGTVSMLRGYTPDEFQEMAHQASSEYQWESGRLPVPGTINRVTYLLGRPAD